MHPANVVHLPGNPVLTGRPLALAMPSRWRSGLRHYRGEAGSGAALDGRICPIVSDKVLDLPLLRCVRTRTSQFVVVGLVLSDGAFWPSPNRTSAAVVAGVWPARSSSRHPDSRHKGSVRRADLSR